MALEDDIAREPKELTVGKIVDAPPLEPEPEMPTLGERMEELRVWWTMAGRTGEAGRDRRYPVRGFGRIGRGELAGEETDRGREMSEVMTLTQQDYQARKSIAVDALVALLECADTLGMEQHHVAADVMVAFQQAAEKALARG